MRRNSTDKLLKIITFTLVVIFILTFTISNVYYPEPLSNGEQCLIGENI